MAQSATSHSGPSNRGGAAAPAVPGGSSGEVRLGQNRTSQLWVVRKTGIEIICHRKRQRLISNTRCGGPLLTVSGLGRTGHAFCSGKALSGSNAAVRLN